MKEAKDEAKVEVVFKNDEAAMNKLIHFIINKILDNIDDIGRIIDENCCSHRRGDYDECG